MRWTPRRKAAVIDMVETGILTMAEAIELYGLSSEEFAGWRWLMREHELAGLRVTRLQQYRPIKFRSKKTH